MKYDTRDFGEIEISKNSIIDFVQPPFGFEDFKKYALVFDEAIGEHIVWLQSLDEPSLCFILLDPSSISFEFNPGFPNELKKLLGDDECECWSILTIPHSIDSATANLKSPIFINQRTNFGAQILLEQDYPVRYLISEGAQKRC